ncbi:hypothetical protein Pan241w_10970 [Gimesia alba]|uniref:Major facilitator superfamily (MFS) profile domain-containing protein n=1 Tax=Gimesia alba TaxID=2527973 RepID=A0A517RAZ2_9PLAN|nr:hypothetical protein [Gimesia alba]QDT41038.1 hypothetical protein Pan241w_10970 [Gimesia alba]
MEVFILAALLGGTFTAMKLWGAIKWPWIWVLCPLWLSALVILIVGVIAGQIEV